ncbi:MAG: MFS transporter [Stappiaceae bacterium]
MVQTIAPILALLLSVGFMLVGHGLQTTLLPIRADLESFGDLSIGMISSGYFAGFVLGCVLSPYAVLRAGHIRAFAALVSLSSAASLAYLLSVDPISWTIARATFGFCIAGFYIIVESWLNERTSNEARGLVMSIYIVINFAAIMVGQIGLTFFDPLSFAPFVIASIMVSLAVLPVSLTRSAQPAPIALFRFRPVALYRVSPAAIIGSVFVGLANGSLWALSPLYAIQIGLDSKSAAIYAAVMILGGAVAQWPLGRLSDKIDRRIVLIGLCIASSSLCILVALWSPSAPVTAILCAGIIGMATQPAYAIVFAHGYDQTDPEKHSYVETASGLMLAFGMGSTIGPIVATLVMSRFSVNGFYYFIAVVELCLALYLLWRMTMRAVEPDDEKTDWNLASTAPVGGVITADPLDESDPDVYVPEPVYSTYETPTEEEVAEAWESGAEELEQVMASENDEA